MSAAGSKFSHGPITYSSGGGGSVTSVGLAAPSFDFAVTGSPVIAAGTLTFNWLNGIIHDVIGVDSVDFYNRNLISSISTNISIDWENRLMYDQGGFDVSIDYDNRLLHSATFNVDTLLWDRCLMINSVNNIVIDWDNCLLYDVGGDISIDFDTRNLINDSGFISYNYKFSIVNDVSGVTSISGGTRTFFDEFGIGVATWLGGVSFKLFNNYLLEVDTLGAAPPNTSLVSLPLLTYGSGARILTTPNAWIPMIDNTGTNGVVPFYYS